jgi:hypothetical protein
MQYLEVGDLVLLINASYNPELIGHVGTVMHSEDHVAGFDKFGCYISGNYVVVDLPDAINRHGTTLWYLKPKHLIRITPDNLSEAETTETLSAT